MFWLALVCAGLLPALSPAPAHAYFFSQPDLGIEGVVTGNDCYGPGPDDWSMPCVEMQQTSKIVCPGPGLTRRIMPCIKETLLNVTNEMLIPFSEYMADTVTVACTLAILLLGALMVGGKTTAPFKDTLVLMVKLGAVSMFSYNFGGFFSIVLDTMDQLLGLVANTVIFSGSFANSAIITECPYFDTNVDNYYGGWTIIASATSYGDTPELQIWDAVDCALNSVIGGINGTFTITMGITGFILACLGSNTVGIFIGFLGIRLIIQFIWAMLRSLYIYIAAYMGICVMVLVSPIFIPTLLFSATKGYFERWLKTFISFIIQPVILFAYLAMLLTAFDIVIFNGPNSLYHAIVGDAAEADNFRKKWEEGGMGSLGGWLMSHGGFAKDFKAPVGMNINAKDADADARRNEGRMPERAMDIGAAGIRSARLVQTSENNASMELDRNQQRSVLNRLGLGGIANKNGGIEDRPLNYFEFNVPVQVVDWAFLAKQQGFDPKNDSEVLMFMVKILISFLMAMITAYVFVELLDTLPFIGSGLASANGIVDKDKITSSLSQLTPPGNDFMKNLQKKLGGS
ncbi:MAG: type IV secretion system protein [Rickettsiales bacterium]|nr:type IV secretion system protein [Rickettsiales bacterium]